MPPRDLSKFDRNQWLPIGWIVGPQGLKGEMRIYPDTDFPERFEEPGKRWLCLPYQSEPEPVELLKGRYLNKKGLYIIKLAGTNSRDQVEKLKQSTLLVPIHDRPVLAQNEYYLPDLVGLDVSLQGQPGVIGQVISLISAGNDLLEIQLIHSPEKALVPFVKEIVTSINLETRTIEIAPPPGLLPD